MSGSATNVIRDIVMWEGEGRGGVEKGKGKGGRSAEGRREKEKERKAPVESALVACHKTHETATHIPGPEEPR
jgi:hypothetical protein